MILFKEAFPHIMRAQFASEIYALLEEGQPLESNVPNLLAAHTCVGISSQFIKG